MFEKSQVFNLVDSKLASAFDGDLFGFEHLRKPNDFCSVLSESTVINFDVNEEIGVFPGKVNYVSL